MDDVRCKTLKHPMHGLCPRLITAQDLVAVAHICTQNVRALNLFSEGRGHESNTVATLSTPSSSLTFTDFSGSPVSLSIHNCVWLVSVVPMVHLR